jgi:hypothetical protein
MLLIFFIFKRIDQTRNEKYTNENYGVNWSEYKFIVK